MRHEGEPSVEEILESIKKVIARDNRDQADALRRRRESGGTAASAATHSAPGFGATVFSAPYEAGDEEPEDVLDLSAMDFADTAPAPDPGPDPEPAPALTNDQAADAMRQSLAALAMLAEPAAAPRIVRSGETSLEGMVREMLRPMMAQWLDAHLPEIVERLVTAEIARIAGKKR
jgi:cell pole-organizing protein PopZ